jgi:hypothetical protein
MILPRDFKVGEVLALIDATAIFFMHNQHVWTERTEEGEKREVRAVKFGGNWRIQSKLASADAWTYHDPALLEDLIELRDLLFRKYQRRRAAYEDVVLIEKTITARGGDWRKTEDEDGN